MNEFVKKLPDVDPLSKVTAATGISKTLDRSTFTTSRLAEFASRDELTRQIGHSPSLWPVVILKELVDNALDACERAGVAPEITVEIDDEGISVWDNGNGIDPDVVERILDYSSKTSSNAAYVSPTRGQQGNAMQTLIAMSHAITGLPGVTLIESRGTRHTVTFLIDPVEQAPTPKHERMRLLTPSIGTRIKISWPRDAIIDAVRRQLSDTAFDYRFLNPHLRLTYKDGERLIEPDEPDPEETVPAWEKWLPTNKTSAHWYDLPSLKTLLAAEITKARRDGSKQRTVADFVTDFCGLSGSIKPSLICKAVDAKHIYLNEFFARGDSAIGSLLSAMKDESRIIKPRDLGVIGEENVRILIGDDRASRYKRLELEHQGVPYLVEIGFGYRKNLTSRVYIAGFNWSVSVTGDPFEHLGDEGIGSLLAQQRVTTSEPVVFFLHIVSPRLAFIDKGKSKIDLPAYIDQSIVNAIEDITKPWTKQRKAEEKDASARLRRDQQLTQRDKPASIKDAAYLIMHDAYMAASDNGTLPANARQIMYAARPEILRLTEKEVLNDSYFIQNLLVDYMNEHTEECANWDVVFSDRGHFEEPHTRRVVGLGTIAVRQYLSGYGEPHLSKSDITLPSIQTAGPHGRYGGVLFVEKEGFKPLLDRARVGARYDLAITSTKGMSNTALRELIDGTCARYNIPLFILHDFDISGFSIASTLHQSNRRYRFDNQSGIDFEVHDLGLRLEDVELLGLQSEPANVTGKRSAMTAQLQKNGVSPGEIRFLLGGASGPRRVELNAMTSRQFVDLLEGKLQQHGVKKVIPGQSELDRAYSLFARGEKARKAAQEAMKGAEQESVKVPPDLERQVSRHLSENPEQSWDDAIWAIVSSMRRT